MNRRMLSDAQWARICDLLPGKPTDKGGRAADNWLFVEAVLYSACAGNPWRDLPPEFGNWHSMRDPSAILVGGLNRATMTLDVVEAEIARRVPDLIIDRAIELQREYRCVAWGVETVQFQEFMYTELLKRAALAGIAFPGVPMAESVEKELRIVSLQPHIANGKIRLHHAQGVLIEQLKFWP